MCVSFLTIISQPNRNTISKNFFLFADIKVDSCFFVPCFPAFFYLLMSLGQKGLIILLLGPFYMGKNTSPARPGADKRGNSQSLFT